VALGAGLLYGLSSVEAKQNREHDEKAQWKILSTSGLDWTMVMPPKLMNWKPRGKLKVDGEALPRNALFISRADVADFMMQQIGNPEWVGKGVYVAY
jgi:putative NADH-flavin reductase